MDRKTETAAVVSIESARRDGCALTPAEVARLRKMLEQFDQIVVQCPIAKRAVSDR